jgi:hypothetical protein
MDACIVASNLAEGEQGDLCYEGAHACRDDSRGGESGQLVCLPFQQPLLPNQGLFGIVKVQVVDILPQKWFPLELEKRLPDSDSENENDDLEFFDLDSEMKSTSLEVLVEGASIDLDSIQDE